MMRFTFLIGALLAMVASLSAGPVDQHGQLRVQGNRIVGKDGKPVSFAGNSFFWSQWKGEFWNASCIDWLKRDWKSDLVRAAVGVELGGYLENPDRELARVQAFVDDAIAAGLYVIIDWHDHHAEQHVAEAERFFQTVAQKYRGDPHVIYEIYNEPLQVSWSKVIKPYAERVIAAIRTIDAEALVLVGTPNWSQLVDEAADDPLEDGNVAYTLHFYAGSHKQWLRDKAAYALGKGAALMVTEWGTCNSDGAGPVDEASTREWMEFIRTHQLSHCNWAVSDKPETASIVVPGSASTGEWKQDQLTPSGRLAREIIRGWSAPAAAK